MMEGARARRANPRTTDTLMVAPFKSEMTIKPKPVDDHTSFLLKSKRQQSQQRVAVSSMVDTYSVVRSRFFLVYVVKKYIILS